LNPLRRLGRAVRQCLLQWPLQVLGLLLLVMGAWVVFYTYQSSERMVRQYATDSAQTHAHSITQFRNFYTQELVPRAVQGGMDITHDFRNRDGALPLPATLTIELGHYLSQVDGGTQVRLYSDQPFPWRVGERQLDEFQQAALVHLRSKPDEPYVREDSVNGQRVLRYAQADRMLATCVACHNSYPGSPKVTWLVGDVRGALEVVLPVSQWQLASTSVLNRTFYVLLSLLFAGFVVIWLSVRGLRHTLLEAKNLSADRKTAIEQLSEQIDERAAVERDLRLSESKLNSIFQSVPEAIVVADTQGRIVQCNGATGTMFGYTTERLLGQRIQMLMDPKEQARHDGYMAQYLSTGVAKLMNQPRVVQGLRSDGSLFPLRLTISETQVDQGHFFVGVMQDFTAIHNAQALLVEAKNKAEQDNRLRGEFLANMSHEIRTPMNGILGMTELALGTDDTKLHKEYLTLARDSANHLLHIINEILDFSKIEANALELECLPVSPAQLVRHTARSLEQLATTKGVALLVETDPSVPDWVMLDPVRMRQVLTNLIGNAIKFTDVGHVRVSTACAATDDPAVVTLTIRIADTGVGFDPTRKEALFSPFTQADGSVTRSFGGTGLGLAITRRLLQLMGGDITADATPGQGAVFEARLPLRLAAPEVVRPAAPKSSEPSPSVFDRRLSVLLVEDHDINRKLAEIMLERMGCDGVTASDGEQALSLLRSRDFDVVLMDVMMPVMDGLSALRLLREHEAGSGRRTPVLMVTAHAMTGDRERFLAAGADGYVSKPMSQMALEREIKRVVGSGL